jgi:single-strand DNA-binding protein
MNVWTGVGRLGRDAELRYTGSGKSVTSFSMAVNRRKKGGNEQTPLWLNVTIWGKLAEVLTPYLKKGKQVVVSGELDTREYEYHGEKRTSTEINAQNITLIGSRQDSAEPANEPQELSSGTEVTDEDIPF